MKILMVEDDDFKASKIKKVVLNVSKDSNIVVKDNVSDAFHYLRYRESDFPDRIILDMSLPAHSPKIGEGVPLSLPTGGIELLLLLRYKKLTNIPIIILTQYPDIEIDDEYIPVKDAKVRISEVYGMNNVFVEYYINEIDNNHSWVNSLVNFLER